MAPRKFLYMNQSEGFAAEQGAADELTLGKVTLSGIDGVAINAGGQLISNLGEPSASSDAARKVDVTNAQAAAESYADGIVATEEAARIAADGVLQGNIDAEEAARIAADGVLQGNIDDEESARIAADGVLQTNIDDEESARIAADTTLQGNIDSEATTRANADDTLQDNIDTEQQARIDGDAAVTLAFETADDLLEADYIARDVVVLDSAKAYADSLQAGFIVKEPARALVRSDEATLSGLDPVDGVAIVAGDRILVARQTPSVDNGIYVAAAGAWTRSTDMDVSADFKDGVSVFVGEGTTYADSTWVLITNNPIVMGTTPVAFIQFSGLGQITAGAGLSKTGNTLNVEVGDGIAISADAVTVELSTTPGLQFESGKLAAKPDATRGLDKDGSGLFVKFDDAKALAMDSTEGLQVVADADYGLAIDSSEGLRIDLAATPGLQFSAGKLDAKNDATRALGKDASGLFVKYDETNAMTADASAGLQVKYSRGLEMHASEGLRVKANNSTALVAYPDTGVNLIIKSDGGMMFDSDQLAVKTVSADRLSKSASGLDVVGLPSSFKINGVATTGASVTAAALNTLSTGVEALAAGGLDLHFHSKLRSTAVCLSAAAGKALYFSANNTVSVASCSAASTARVVGMSVAAAAANSVTVQGAGPLAVFSGLTAGTPYYLGSNGSPVEFSALVSGDRVIRLGFAVNATTINLMIQDMGAKA